MTGGFLLAVASSASIRRSLLTSTGPVPVRHFWVSTFSWGDGLAVKVRGEHPSEVVAERHGQPSEVEVCPKRCAQRCWHRRREEGVSRDDAQISTQRDTPS